MFAVRAVWELKEWGANAQLKLKLLLRVTKMLTGLRGDGVVGKQKVEFFDGFFKVKARKAKTVVSFGAMSIGSR